MRQNPLTVAALASLCLFITASLCRADDEPKQEKQEKRTWGFLGVQLDQGEMEKAVIDTVVPDGPAEKAGLKAGDVVLKVGDTEVKGPQALVEAMHKTKPGDKLDVVIQRDGKEQTIKVTLGDYPEQP
jgi:S1-C subfamily serine protease